MTDQTSVHVDEVVFTDTGTGLYSPPGPATIDNDHEAKGPTGAVPGPPASVITHDFPYDSDGNLLPTAKPVTAEPEAKQVTKAGVEDKSVKPSGPEAK